MATPENKPLTRYEALQPLSREHHQGLLLCWKIKKGFSKEVEPQRIKEYADWFWENLLRPHFEIEEKLIFPVLGKKNELVAQALEEHRHLQYQFEEEKDINAALKMIEKDLETHIRFEERVLFNKIQEEASEEQLQHISQQHDQEFSCGTWEDEFWN